ncbi:AAA family ATPase, putative [Talaromyces stipitatus ATCC 10500]|uniref:AAA family ATPase, putative n=1 Tax=Talaromyces stipitatus (strain ATCC 10500 / CBS 375.48 / QM 6759 / NRRL 1006) TaxID=441959 RepID=B8MHN6_TALSN|nr:AAA family ATPase, putative [Talaromyces stipitatus ATCC 10500]EED16017.1 AAA family ATPase, putative [Talaromyces stipitatus ATCC 10500]
MARHSSKRTLEEIANKSDSDDYDYSDHATRPSRSARKSKKRSKPVKKRRRRDSDDDDISEDDLLSEDDELSYEESEEDDGNVEKNARGLRRRKAVKNRPAYKEDSDDEDELDEDEQDEDEEEEVGKKPPAKVITLKLGKAASKQATLETNQRTRRSTRHNRDPSEDIYALTNSGRHVETIEEGIIAAAQGPLTRRASKTVSVPIHEEDENDSSNVKSVDEAKASQLEVLESDPQNEYEDGPSNEQDTAENGDVEMADEGVIPESDNEAPKAEGEGEGEDEDDEDEGPVTRRRNRPSQKSPANEPDSQADSARGRSSRKRPPRSSQRKQDESSDFEPNEEESEDDDILESPTASPRKADQTVQDDDSSNGRRPGLRGRKSQSRGRDSEVYVDEAEELAEELQDLQPSRRRRRNVETITYEDKPRRSRKDVDYRLIRPDLILPIEEEEGELAVNESPSRRGRGAAGSWQRTLFSTSGPFGGGGPAAILGPPGAPGATANADSDSSDDEVMQVRGGLGAPGALAPGLGGVGLPPAQAHNAEAAAPGLSGTPANFGKVKDKQALADADPLGIDPNVNFDSVGGLQGHIDQLKEMVALPLLYPEIFQRFHIVPPRGVLFHGPPGTGKTLMARALASSVSSEGRKVTFYMRKGADALSKWVGEAERQLRLLFEEARKTQPSIIFFDEIDGLAPVRSSKQEQIHASIVSTLLALMDGMDGRGQVIVIGATNRPDSIDPALRRPGRFDREFYFPLPNKEGRRAILDIHTKNWDPPLPEPIKDELAELTKGYGGADLRALCTESALNAVQRRYPQIYKSSQKLLIDPKTIEVTPKDFMISIKKIVPSSERSTSSGATPLPKSVEPLLRDRFVEIKHILTNIIPQSKRLTALEEAEFEEPHGGASFKREQMHQEFETSRIFRPRLLIRGAQGMGQQYLAGAILHHFEGLHVQSFDLPTLLSDSTRSPEATVVQLFAEVKRHKPSVIYIPNVQTWYDTVGPLVVSTFNGLLRSIPPTDPVLLLGVLEDGEDSQDPAMLKSLFGYSQKNIYALRPPDQHARHEYFGRIMDYLKTSPHDFPDPENRKKRRLELLEVAPPPAPKPAPPLSKEQLKAQKRKDRQTLNLLKIRIQPIMDQIKKYKRFRTGVIDDSQIRYLFEEDDPSILTSDLPVEQQTVFRPFEKAQDKYGVPGLRETATGRFFYNLEIVTIEKRLSNGYYKRPKDFLADIKRIAKDARTLGDQERLLRANELLTNVEVDIGGIEQTDPALVAECEAVYNREMERENEAMERAKKTNTFGEMGPPPNSNVPHGNTSSLSSGPIVLGQPFVNGARPTTPSRLSNVVSASNGHHGSGSDLNPGDTSKSDQSNLFRGEDGDTLMTNSDELDFSGRHTANSSFGQSAQLKHPLSNTAPSLQIRRESGLSSLSQKAPMTPMAPGSQPGDYSNDASTTQTTSDKKTSDQSTGPQLHTQSPVTGSAPRVEFPDLTSYPDRISQEDHLPDTQQDFPFSQASHVNGSQSQPRLHRPGSAPGAPQPHTAPPSNIKSLLNNEGQSPHLIIDHEYIEKLRTELTLRTSGCTVEQLEQINTHLMDCLWKKRGEWDRTKVAAALQEEFNDVFQDMQENQEFMSMSQLTKEQLASRGGVVAPQNL